MFRGKQKGLVNFIPLGHGIGGMELFAPKEADPEKRAVLAPEETEKLRRQGLTVRIETGLGRQSGFTDKAYTEAGAAVTPDRQNALGAADIVLRLSKPRISEIMLLKRGSLHISFLDPASDPQLLKTFASAGVSAVSLEMIPPAAAARPMDAVASQASLAGYCAVIKAAERLNKVIPMMMTPAGIIRAARFFIIGTGAAGMQAIATAKRLGAQVEACGARPGAEALVQSLGAKFVHAGLDEIKPPDSPGAARTAPPEPAGRRHAVLMEACSRSDAVITSAEEPASRPPLTVIREMTAAMRRGSVIVDLTAGEGEGVEGIQPDEEIVTPNGVRLIGLSRMAGLAARDATRLLSANLHSLLARFWNSEEKTLEYNLEDEILQNCLLTHEGKIIHESFQLEQPEHRSEPRPASGGN